MDTENDDVTPLRTNKKCMYCTAGLSRGAKVCTVCSRYQNWLFNHFRADHFGILITIGMVVVAYHNLQETRQKRVEATAALERVERAEVTVANLQTVLKDAHDVLSDLKSNVEFNILITQSTNDDRVAFDRLVDITRQPGPFQKLADTTVGRIVFQIGSSLRLAVNIPWNEYNIDPNQSSLQELQTKYKVAHPFYRPDYLSAVWSQERFSKRERLQMLADAIQSESSLWALDRACRLMNTEANINKNILGASAYLRWWEQNKARY